jgi:hypothetical protein
MPKVSVVQAAMVYKVTNRTILRWVKEDGLQHERHLYDLDALQKAYDKRRALKHMKRFV